MIKEQLINDALILNQWIKENNYTIKDLPKIMHYFFLNVVQNKFQRDSLYWMRLTKLLKYGF
jgi:hypothetical protein